MAVLYPVHTAYACAWADHWNYVKQSRAQYQGGGLHLGAAQFLSTLDGLLQSQQRVADGRKLHCQDGADVLAALHFFR